MMSSTVLVDLRLALQDFVLDVDVNLPGQGVSVLFGRSGSGKTTLLRCLAGLERGEGRVQVCGETWQDEGFFLATHKRSLGYVFQDARLFPHLSVQGNLGFGLKRVHQADSQNMLDQAIELLGIEHLLERKPDRLSGGERQRVAIAQALALNPRILLMDEPLAALDESRKQEILPYLERLHGELEIPLLYITHSTDELTRLADHLVVLEQGKSVACGPVSEVLAGFDLTLNQGEEAGTVLSARVTQIDSRYHLARAEFPGGEFWARDMGFEAGDRIRLRVLARDVSLLLEEPVDSSILNSLAGVVDGIGNSDHPGIKLVRVIIGSSPLICRLSLRSVNALALTVGKPVWVQVKSVAIIE